MNSIKVMAFSICLLAATISANEGVHINNMKLYAMDCGSYEVSDMKDLSSTGKYDGQKLSMVNPCFLIRHPKGDLLWDTGHIDSLVDKPDGEISGVWHAKSKVKLITQLEQIGLEANDIEYLSLSHIHPDHSGNSNKFIGSTFIVNELEHKYMFSKKIRSYFGEFYSELENTKTILFTNQYDVFKDGTVVIHSMPGHTPGSSVLLLRFSKAGNVLLTGDLYVHERGRTLKTMHKYNAKQLTMDSRNKFEYLAKRESARVIIQHEKKDFEYLPKFPKFLD